MRLMPFFSNQAGHARLLALAGAVSVIMGASAIRPAFAGDDGYEPIWSGLGGIIGLTTKGRDPTIDYRERGRLVLPPKMDLPTPVSADAEKTAAWPLDPDIERERREKADRLHILGLQSNLAERRDGHRLTPNQLRADRSTPGNTDRCAHQNHQANCGAIPFHNIFESLGLAKADDVVAGQEPDRDWLTDPPKGFRVPTQNMSAQSDAGDAKKPNQRDPRALLYQAPDTNNN
jgi:hypothetical protein